MTKLQFYLALFVAFIMDSILSHGIMAQDHKPYPMPPANTYTSSFTRGNGHQVSGRQPFLREGSAIELSQRSNFRFPQWWLPADDKRGTARDSYTSGNGQLSVVSRALLGYATAVYAEGNYAYVGAGGAFVIFDVSDSSQPQIIGKLYLPNELNCVYVQGDYAYVGHMWSGLIVIDVSDKTEPFFVAHATEPYVELLSVSNIIARDNYLYVAAVDRGFVIFDITNPSDLQLVGTFTAYGAEWPHHRDWAEDVAVSGNYAYLAFSDGDTDDMQWGFWVVDISNPSNPEGVGLWDPGHDVFNVEITEGYAIVDNYVVDVSNPEAPTPVAIVPGGMGVSMIVDTLLYMSGGGLQVFSISDPENIELLSEYVNPWYNKVWVSDQQAYMAGWYAGLGVFDVANTNTIVYISNFPTGGFANGVTVSGNYAYVTDGWLRILDISDIENPVEISHFENTGYAVNVLVKDSIAYVSATYGGFRIVDVSNPYLPQEIAYYDTLDLYVNHAFVKDSLIFLTTSSHGFVILDVTDIGNPVLIHSDTTYYALEVAVKDNFAVLASGALGLNILDVSNPDSIQETDHIDFSEPIVVPVTSVDIKDSLIFVGLAPVIASVHAVVVFGLSEHGKASEILNLYYDPGFWTAHIKVVKNLVYLSDFYLGFSILDLNDTYIEFLDGYQTNFYLWGSDVLDNKIFLAHDAGGLHILKYDSTLIQVNDTNYLLSNFNLKQNYPNPFNASTVISYHLPLRAKVKLKVFDVLGRELQTLLNEYQNAGSYNLLWDASNHPSGIYFCQIRVGNLRRVKKMVLLR